MELHNYIVNLSSKEKLKKLIFLKHLKLTVNWEVSEGHKNTFLLSPFHFKTVKTHLSAPSIRYSLAGSTKPYLGGCLVGVMVVKQAWCKL